MTYEDGYLLRSSAYDSSLKVKEFTVLPIEQLSTTASYDQSIDTLDKYKMKITFAEMQSPSLTDHIESYDIDWGDGTTSTYTVSDVTASHIYSRSGDYALKITVNDNFGFTHTIDKSYKIRYEGHLTHGYLWVKEYKEPVAVTTSSISLASIGLFALTETGKYKLLALLPLLIPMYTRIQKEDVLDQFVRGQIYGYIKTHPGVHYNQIRRGIGVKNGTLSYHLSVLEKTELIKSRTEGVRYRVFYPTGMKFPKNQRFRLTEFQVEILDIIKNNRGINQKDIARKLKKKPQTINYNIKVLFQADLIDMVKKGRHTLLYEKEEQPIDPDATAQ